MGAFAHVAQSVVGWSAHAQRFVLCEEGGLTTEGRGALEGIRNFRLKQTVTVPREPGVLIHTAGSGLPRAGYWLVD